MIEATNMTTTLTVILTLIFLAVLLWFISPQLGKTLVKLDMSANCQKLTPREECYVG